jgi:exonuclease VII small subunit
MMATAAGSDGKKAETGPEEGEVAELSYARAGQELDTIIEEFETGVVDVDRLVDQLERATLIVDELDRRLRRTRMRVEELVPRLEAVGREELSDDGPDDALEDEVEEEADDGAAGDDSSPGLF